MGTYMVLVMCVVVVFVLTACVVRWLPVSAGDCRPTDPVPDKVAGHDYSLVSFVTICLLNSKFDDVLDLTSSNNLTNLTETWLDADRPSYAVKASIVPDSLYMTSVGLEMTGLSIMATLLLLPSLAYVTVADGPLT